MGAALDPRFKELSFLTEEKREMTQSVVREKLAEIGEAAPEADIQEPGDNAQQRDPSKLAFLLGAAAAPVIHKKTAAQEYEDFLREDPETHTTEPLHWWKKNDSRFPIVAKLARKYLAIPATSVPSERVFSPAGNIVNAKRSCLSSENVNMLVFLSKNLRGQPC